MLLTEPQAKKQTCPHMSIADASERIYRPALCQASLCMAWRWSGKIQDPSLKGAGAAPQLEFGFCGLAGVPMGVDRG